MRPKVNRYEAWPHLLTSRSGTVLCGYTARTQHLAVDGSASVLCRSTSGTGAWKQVMVVRSDDAGWGFEAIADTADHGILVMHSRNRSGTHDKPDLIRVDRSMDDGRSFTTLASFPTDGSVVTVGDLTELSDGRLLAPYHGDGWGVILSDDHGETWSIEGRSNGGKWPQEGRIFEAGDDLLMTGRNKEAGLLLLRSSDRGDSWEQAEPTGLGPRYEGLHVDGENVELVLVDRESGEISYTSSTSDRLFRDPEDWEEECRLGALDPSGAPAEQGYPSLTALKNGQRLLAAYDGENPITDIRLWTIA